MRAREAAVEERLVVVLGIFSTPASAVLMVLAPLGTRCRPRLLLFFFLLAMVMVFSEGRGGGGAEEAACEEDWEGGEGGKEGEGRPRVFAFTSACYLNVRANQNETNSINNQCALTSATSLRGLSDRPLVRATSPLSSKPSTAWVHRLFARLHVAQALRGRPVRWRPANSTNDMLLAVDEAESRSKVSALTLVINHYGCSMFFFLKNNGKGESVVSLVSHVLVATTRWCEGKVVGD